MSSRPLFPHRHRSRHRGLGRYEGRPDPGRRRPRRRPRHPRRSRPPSPHRRPAHRRRQSVPLPREQRRLRPLRPSPGSGLADRQRRRRRSSTPLDRRQTRHHRQQVDRPRRRSRSHPPHCHQQRRLPRLLDLPRAEGARTTPSPNRPAHLRTSSLTRDLTQTEPHPSLKGGCRGCVSIGSSASATRRGRDGRFVRRQHPSCDAVGTRQGLAESRSHGLSRDAVPAWSE